MIGRALDSNNDLIVSDGSFRLVEDGAEVVQHVRTRLLMYYNEWFLDQEAGTKYFEEVFVKPADLANIESLLKARILETDGVNILTEFEMNYEGGGSKKIKCFLFC